MENGSFDRETVIANLSMLGVAVIWGMNFVAMKYLIDRVGALEVVLIRVYLATIVFGAFLLFKARVIPHFNREEWRLLGAVGFFGVVTNQVFVSYGTSYLSAAIASMLATSTPIFMAILSRIILGERLTRRKAFGIALAFSGFIIVLLFGSGSAEFSVDNMIGVAIILLAPLSWTISTILSKPLMIKHDPKIVTAISTIIAGVILLPGLARKPSLASDVAGFDAVGWLAALATSVLAIVVAYTIWYQGLRKLEPTQIAIYVYLVPFFGVLFAWLLLGETITIFLLLGGITILSGVIVTNSGRRPPAISAETRLADGDHLKGRSRPEQVFRGEESHVGK